MKQILELVEAGTAERPIKGFALDLAIYVAQTKQAVLDEQTVSNERVANIVVWAKDIAKFMVFSADGSTYEEKDLPSGDVDLSEYAKLNSSNVFTAQQKIVNAELKVEKVDGTNLFRVRTDNDTVTVKGTLTADSVKSLILDSGQNSNLQIKHNGNTRIFVGDAQTTFTSNIQAQQGIELQGDSTYTGTIDNDDSLVNKKYVDDAGSSYDGEGFGVPGAVDVGHGLIEQRVVTGNYRNNVDEAGDLNIRLLTDDGVQNFRFYYSLPYGTQSGRKLYVQVDQKAGTTKTIRSGEIWQCEIKVGRFFDDFFWSKVTDGASTFALEEQQLLAGMAGGQLFVNEIKAG